MNPIVTNIMDRIEYYRLTRDPAQREAIQHQLENLIEQHETQVGQLVEVLKTCANKFREYEAIHAAKPDPVKAASNAELAKLCELAIAKARQAPGTADSVVPASNQADQSAYEQGRRAGRIEALQRVAKSCLDGAFSALNEK